MKRGAIHKNVNAKQVLVWFPDALISAMQECVVRTDTDRSKLIRQAVREKLEGLGISVQEQ